jgi:AAA domain/Nuclease-related domain
MCQGGHGVAVVVGRAGTGKTFALGIARHAWQLDGYRLLAAAPTGIATMSLQGEGFEDVATCDRLLGELDRGREQLDARTVLVVDEAGMLGSRKLGRLLEHAHYAQAKVVLVGDDRQLAAIDAGGGFRALRVRLGAPSWLRTAANTRPGNAKPLELVRSGLVEDAVAAYQAMTGWWPPTPSRPPLSPCCRTGAPPGNRPSRTRPARSSCWPPGGPSTAHLLAALERYGWAVLHDLALPGSQANLDHLVIGPGGVFVVDSKHYRGRLHLDPTGRLWHGRYSLAPTLWAVSFEADQAALVLPEPGVAVLPVVAVHGAQVPLGQDRHRGGAGGGGPPAAKHAARPPGGAGARAGRLAGRPGPGLLPRCCLTLAIAGLQSRSRPCRAG